MRAESRTSVLLVEDEILIAMAEKMDLEAFGYGVNHVETGEQALQVVHDNTYPINIILMDIDLGSGMDGTETAKKILNHNDLPIVFLSSHTERAVVEKTEEITSYGYIVKNTGIVVLDASIKMALRLFEEKYSRIRAEQKLLEAKKKIEDNEMLLRLSTELGNIAVWEYNFHTNTMSRSDNHDILYGLPPQPIWEIETFLHATHPDDREMSNAYIMQSVAKGGPDRYSFDFRVIYPDTTIHWLSVIGQVVKRDGEGKGILVRGCLIDITERQDL